MEKPCGTPDLRPKNIRSTRIADVLVLILLGALALVAMHGCKADQESQRIKHFSFAEPPSESNDLDPFQDDHFARGGEISISDYVSNSQESNTREVEEGSFASASKEDGGALNFECDRVFALISTRHHRSA